MQRVSSVLDRSIRFGRTTHSIRRYLSSTASTPEIKPQNILSGIQPTGTIHLGNYLGALVNWVHLQDIETAKRTVSEQYAARAILPLYCIVDLHALTIPANLTDLASRTRSLAATLLAIGLNRKTSNVFIQSHVPEHTELAWILSCVTPVNKLFRMTQFKDKASKVSSNSNGEGKQFTPSTTNVEDIPKSVGVGLLTYPVLMAADVLLYQATHIPVGDDQTQHLELTRELGRTFNHVFKTKVFTDPQPIYNANASRIMSLTTPTSKMSKSDPSELSRITLEDTDDQIKRKISRAVTDSLGGVTYEPEARPGVSNLVDIFTSIKNEQARRSARQEFLKRLSTNSLTIQEIESHLAQLQIPKYRPEDIASQYASSKLSAFKSDLADLVISEVAPIRGEITKYLADSAELDEILRQGASNARVTAAETMMNVRRAVGMVPAVTLAKQN